MKQFSTPAKARKWAKASKAIILHHALLVGCVNADMADLADVTFGPVLSQEEADFVMSCLQQVLRICILKEEDRLCQIAIAALRKVAISYREGVIPKQ